MDEKRKVIVMRIFILFFILVSAVIAILIVFFDMVIRYGVDRLMTLGG